MSRKRMVSPEFYTDEKILELPIPARLMFIGIWNHADDEGIFKNSPKQLKVQIYPADEEITINVVIKYLEKMVNLKLLTKGTNIDGSQLLRITKWLDHQKINRPTPSKYVFTPLSINDRSVSDQGAVSEDSRPIEGNIIEVNIIEDNRSKDKRKESSKKNPEKQKKQDFTFESVYSYYPLKKAKQEAMKAFNRIPKKAMNSFIKGLEAHIKFWERYNIDKQFIPYMATFINHKRWEDELIPPTSEQPKFKNDLDKEIHHRNHNVAKETKRMAAYIKHADDIAVDEIPDLNKLRKTDAQPISEAIGQFISNAQPDTSTDGK